MARPRTLGPRPDMSATTLWGLPGMVVVAQQMVGGGDTPPLIELICDSVDPCPEWPVRATSQRRWHDVPHLGQPTRLVIRRFRRDGPDGRRSHACPPGLIGPPLLMTERLAESAILLCLEMPLAEACRRLGVPARKLRALFNRYLVEFDARYRPEAAHALGIDGVHVDGDTYTVIADIEGNRLIEVLPDHSFAGLVAALAKMERRDLVGVIAIDASALERSAIRAAFLVEGSQRVVIALDRRHAIALVLKALANLRKGLGFRQHRRRAVDGRRARVDTLKALLERPAIRLSENQRAWLAAQFELHPDGGRLRCAYEAKEAFLRLWECPDRTAASQAFAVWRNDLMVAGIADVFATAVATLGRDWREEFLAAIAAPGMGTGYVEALNRQLKLLQARARGNASFAVLRARMLYAHGRPQVRSMMEGLAADVARDLAVSLEGGSHARL